MNGTDSDCSMAAAIVALCVCKIWLAVKYRKKGNCNTSLTQTRKGMVEAGRLKKRGENKEANSLDEANDDMVHGESSGRTQVEDDLMNEDAAEGDGTNSDARDRSDIRRLEQSANDDQVIDEGSSDETDIENEEGSVATDDGTNVDLPATEKPIQILPKRKEKEDRLQVNVKALRSILLHKDIGTKNIAIISIAGAFRLGKSFMLNLFLRYFRNKGYENEGWLDLNTGGYLDEGIKWKSGPVGHTTGIEIWSEPFIVKNEAGEEFAVLLMDTQGNFDHGHDKQESVSVFGLSTLLSSLQIFNVSKQIQTNDLEYLQCFTEYARTSDESCGEGERPIPFQSLLFLVRDWAWPRTHEYGHKEGEKYLSGECLSSNATIKDYFHGCFEQLSCYLMPMPSPKVMKDENDDRLKVSDIGGDFVKNVKNLAANFLHPHKLKAKKIGGVVVDGKCLLEYMKKCSEMMDSGNLPKLTTLMESMVAANNAVSMERCDQDYASQMDQALESATTWDKYEELESKAWSNVKDLFSRKTMYGGRNSEYIENFEKKLNDAKKLYRGKMTKRRQSIVEKMIAELEEKYNEKLKEISSQWLEIHGNLEEFYEETIRKMEELYDAERDEASVEKAVQKAKEQINRSFMNHKSSAKWKLLGRGIAVTAIVAGTVATGGVGLAVAGTLAAAEVGAVAAVSGATAASVYSYAVATKYFFSRVLKRKTKQKSD